MEDFVLSEQRGVEIGHDERKMLSAKDENGRTPLTVSR
jgi:hypothetical protein